MTTAPHHRPEGQGLNPHDDPGYWAGLAQHRASDPALSVWVNASAGTGKTKVLIERVLRLLLPRPDGRPGARPNRILCLTYTKAASAEMTERLLSRVSSWVVMNDHDLDQALTAVLGASPTDDHRRSARQLFTDLVDGPDQVRIMTIHAFCQSVLSRFPLEAGINPNFTLIEGPDLDDLLDQARQSAMINMARDPDLSDVMARLAILLSDDRLGKVMSEILSERRQLTASLLAVTGDDRDRALRQMLGLARDDTRDRWAGSIADLGADIIHDLILLDQGLREGTKLEKTIAARIYDWIAWPVVERADYFDDLARAFFGVNGDRLSDGSKQGKRKADEKLRDLYVACGDVVEALLKKRKMIDLYDANMALFTFVDHMMASYERLKKSRGVLDFDDLIRKTSMLLSSDRTGVNGSQTPSWVMYKLDGGIDHILVDEAQDTNPEQWQIIAALAQSFAGDDPDRSRSLFIVGDQKQSIYRFQGADPDTFEKMLDHFGSGDGHMAVHLDRIPMNTSFRSTSAVLTLVDQVFSDAGRLRDLRLSDSITHVVNRRGQEGRVELWLLVDVVKDEEKKEPWALPITIKKMISGPDLLADRIARRIRDWFDQKTILPSHNRAVEPRDIMILVRKRDPYLSILRSALRSHGIPVSPPDRQEILESIAVEDLVALARFSLLPTDDFSLACVIKSPLIGGGDDDLIKIAPMRAGSLWDALLADPSYASWVSYLSYCVRTVGSVPPYQFLNDVLSRACPAKPHGSGRAAFLESLPMDNIDSINDLLGLALDASQNGVSSLSFIHGLARDNPEIRQSGPGHDNVVRLMTVHGSKGLEAPIVILPDTVKSSRDGQTGSLFWPDDTGAPLPLWVPLASDRPDDIPGVMDRVREADRAEESRLLYVALTRAQDWLIVAGADRASRVPDSWYDAVRAGMDRCATLPGFRMDDTPDGTVYIFEQSQSVAPDRAPHGLKISSNPGEQGGLTIESMIDILKRPICPEPAPARPLRADPAHQRNVPESPLLKDQSPSRFMRGVLTHKLLEILPQLPREGWKNATQTFLAARSDELSPDIQDLIVLDVLGILNHPDYQAIFGPGSRAEVPITGLLPNGRLIAGKIDRLVITNNMIYILDYKTGGYVPKIPGEIPKTYLDQMRTYRDLLKMIYPDHQIRCSLLFTSGPVMMEVDDIL